MISKAKAIAAFGPSLPRLLLPAALATAALLALTAAPASAHLTHNLESSFPVQATGGPQGNPAGDAFDASSGKLWVLDATNQTVDEFAPDGSYQNLQLTGPETPAGSFGFQFFNGVAVDNSGGANAGDVYVADWGNAVIDRFDSAGNYLCQITGSATPSATECNGASGSQTPQSGIGPSGLTVDQSGNLWVSDLANAALDEFGPSGNFITQITDPNIQNPVEIGFDSAGNLYATNFGNDVVKFTGGAFAGVLDPNAPIGLAADPGSDRVYVSDSNTTQFTEYDTAGNQLSSFPAQSGFVLGGAIRPATGELYANDWNNGAIDVYSADLILPDLTTGQATNVTQTTATLTGTVNPAGTQLSDCHFEVGDTFTSPPSEQSVPCVPAAGQIPADSQDHALSADLSGLAPGRSYHFRLVATNPNGTSADSWQGFRTLPPTTAQSCPNDQLRTGDSANLPDCRAYESVTPADIVDGTPIASVYGWPDGQHVFYVAQTPITPSAANGNVQFLLATRSASGWQSEALSPPQGPGTPAGTATANIAPITFIGDFSAAFINNPFDNDSLDQDNGGYDAYRFDLSSSTVSLVSRPDSGPMTPAMLGTQHTDVSPPGAWLAGASADGSEVFFEVNGQVPVAPGTTPDTRTQGDELYERTNGHTYLVGILPDGSVPACGASIANGVVDSFGNNPSFTYGAVAPDGSNLVFTASDCTTGGTYMRDLVDGTTVLLPGNGFAGRTADGAKIFTSDASNGDLAEYDLASGELTDIGQGQLLASSDDGSRVYYLGSDNALHLWDHGNTTIIPGTDAGGYDIGAIAETTNHQNVPVTTPDGSFLLFIDTARLTGYDNQGHQEAYLYKAATNSVICLSCSPSGAPPDSDPSQIQNDAQLLDLDRIQIDPLLPRTMPFVSSDGTRVVFETTDTLLPADHNPNLPGLDNRGSGMDVYEWEADGTGSCDQSSVSGGCLYLLSAARAGISSYLAGASIDLNDVYLITADQLLPGKNGALHIYDARIGGGFAAPPSPAPCSGDACQGAAGGAPPLPSAGTVTFTGPGNASRGPLAGTVKLIHRAVRGARFALSVSVPGSGQIVVSGGGVRTVRRTVAGAGSYRITVALTPRARQALRHGRVLRLALHVRYTPTGGAASTASLRAVIGAARGGGR